MNVTNLAFSLLCLHGGLCFCIGKSPLQITVVKQSEGMYIFLVGENFFSLPGISISSQQLCTRRDWRLHRVCVWFGKRIVWWQIQRTGARGSREFERITAGAASSSEIFLSQQSSWQSHVCLCLCLGHGRAEIRKRACRGV